MKKLMILSLIISGLIVSSCCDKCNLDFEESELDHLNYQFTGSNARFFQNGMGDEISVQNGRPNLELSGKTCGGFGSADEGFCSTSSSQSFLIGNGLDDLEVILVKSREEGSSDNLQMEINMGMATMYVFFDDNVISQTTLDRTESLTINGTTYNDVLTYFFDPNTDCKDPTGPFCVDDDDIVGVDFSLSTGLLRFQVHKGLQEPNEVYTIVN